MKKTFLISIFLPFFFIVNLSWRENDVQKNIELAKSEDAGIQFHVDLMKNTLLHRSISYQTFKIPEAIKVEKNELNIVQNRMLKGRYTVYIHYLREENKKIVEELSIFLENKGFNVDGIEKVNYKNRDIRYFHREDKSGALLLKKHVISFIKIYFKHVNIRIINLSHRYPNANKGALELWLSF
jgi:hypothetical protein